MHTQCVHSGQEADLLHGETVSAIYPGSSYAYLDRDLKAYPRYFNTPNQRAVAQKVAALEAAEAGLITSSGMAAISNTLLAFLKQGDHLVMQYGLYGGTTHFIQEHFPRQGIHFSQAKDGSLAALEAEIRPETKVIYIETPSNPLLAITDVAAVARLAKAQGILTVIDNTFASPINQQPISLGIDISLHSATKYLGGHSDLCAGVVTGRAELVQQIAGVAKGYGGSLNAQSCYLLERSIKTLALRVKQHNQNALALATYLEGRHDIIQVYYPGLPSHQGHETAATQMKGFGGMLSFELAAGIDPIAFQKKLRLIQASMSLGGVESTLCSPHLTSHAYLSPEERLKEGISDGVLRLSVGIEAVGDLQADIAQALG